MAKAILIDDEERLLATLARFLERRGLEVVKANSFAEADEHLRPGRFDELIYVPVPEEAGRRRILDIHTRKMPLAEDVDLDALASRTERFTGADLEDLSRRAGLIALRQSLSVDAVTMAHFEAALEETRASVTPEMEREYEQIQATLKQSAMQLDPIGFVSPGMLRARER